MKNWKDVPHLFANGKFKIQVGETICDIIAWNTHGRFSLYGDEERKEIKLMHCTLIARKVDDISDEEIKWFLINEKYPTSKPYVDDMRQFIPTWANNNEFTQDQFLHLLSIGVYPFSQKHFEDETVIDIKTL